MSDYKVLARKYRPETFADLVGQDAMVRTLRNAFKADRIAQAFVLTGIRGTGKTTTARIIAKGMNCIGPDGTGGPTTDPCGICEHCVEIARGAHVDVMEIDAASNTGVQNVRDVIIETVAYAPAKARFKVFIIDEVHMLSTAAFNALLKTLEEPPAHVKFLFATTEIRKVPVTVLSRCQRFDLRRIEPETMIAMLRRIATAEKAEIADEALGLITRAAEGSARDAQSLLDQAISHGAGETTADQVRAMLGLADRGRVLDLFEAIMRGDAAGALTELGGQYGDGADPISVLRDLAEVTHWLSVVRLTPEAAEDPTISPDERLRGQALVERLSMPQLQRMWQMALKAIAEAQTAPNAMMAAEMAVIRMTHVAEMPPPADLVARIKDANPPPRPPSGGGGAQAASSGAEAVARHAARMSSGTGASGGIQAALAQEPDAALARFPSFARVVDLITANRDQLLKVEVETGVRLVSYRPGRIEFEPSPQAAPDLAQKLGQRLQSWTGVRWAVSVVADGGQPTIAEVRDAEKAALESEARANPLVASIFDAFPQGKLKTIETPAQLAAKATTEALGEVEEEWDPFEDG